MGLHPGPRNQGRGLRTALTHHIEAEQHIFRGISLRVTASIGVHAITDPDETIGEALHLADKALYDAKRSGRNQVKLSLAA